MVAETQNGGKAGQSQLPIQPVVVDPARPDLTADVQIALLQVPENERDAYLKEIERVLERRRSPFGTQSQKLALPERPGYKRHWFNDSPGRVDDAEANGWTKVQSKDKKVVRRVVGSGRDGGALYAYAMEIPSVIWEREMTARHRAAAERMADIAKSPIRAPAGTAQPSDRGKFYSPVEGGALQVRETVAVRKGPQGA